VVSDEDEGRATADNVVSIKDAKPESRVYERTIVMNNRRYDSTVCQHKGPFIVETKLGGVECGDCGAMLNPIYVLEVLAGYEAYWNMRQRDLSKYLAELNEQIKERTRTRCTHCGNMTAIKFKHEMPRTWVPQPY
jgi:DNA-directed RNA polymerase subunit RPC12/RpoP